MRNFKNLEEINVASLSSIIGEGLIIIGQMKDKL